jgi:hypothetical protein
MPWDATLIAGLLGLDFRTAGIGVYVCFETRNISYRPVSTFRPTRENFTEAQRIAVPPRSLTPRLRRRQSQKT